MPIPEIRPESNTTCPLCGGPNGCAPAESGSFDTPCWCTQAGFNAESLALVPEAQRNRVCICQRCAVSPPDPA